MKIACKGNLECTLNEMNEILKGLLLVSLFSQNDLKAEVGIRLLISWKNLISYFYSWFKSFHCLRDEETTETSKQGLLTDCLCFPTDWRWVVIDCAFIAGSRRRRERNINMKHFLLSFLKSVSNKKVQTRLLQRQIPKNNCVNHFVFVHKSYRESYFISKQIKPISVKKTGLSQEIWFRK